MNRKQSQRIEELEEQIATLPKGYVSRKRIHGKERLYLQWREEGKVCSRYLKEKEREQILAQVEERKILQQELKQLRRIEAEHLLKEQVAPYVTWRPRWWLKWQDQLIGEINDDFQVRFEHPQYNQLVRLYTKGKDQWSREEFLTFLADRLISPQRRDIEQILFRCGLTRYDPVQMALQTRGICARDMLWIATSPEELFDDAISQVFESIFLKKVDQIGDSVDTPEGQNVKRYGVSQGHYGIFKERLSPLTTDAESEVAVYKLAELMEVPCCPCWRVDQDTIFSQFQYDFSKEHIVHARQIVDDRGDNELENLIKARPKFLPDLVRMMALDFVTRQEDRHLSNIGIKIGTSGESFYPLYDNGRSLFYEDREETVEKACRDVRAFVTTFGPAGTYLDHLKQIQQMGIQCSNLINLSLSDKQVRNALVEAGFFGYRLRGAESWVCQCLDILREERYA